MKWEYRIERVTFALSSGGNDTDEAVIALDRLGQQGWEAVSVWDGSLGTHILLKRQMSN